MIFFGWGRKTKEFIIDDARRIIVAYSYAHVFFLFTAAWGRKFHLVQLGDQGWGASEISEPDATALNGGITPDIHWWWKWSLLIGVAGLIIIPVFASVF